MSAPAASSLPATSSDVERGGDSSRPPVPNIEVRFEDLRWSIPITAQEQRKGIPTVLGAVARTFTKLPLAIAARLSHTARAAQAAPPPFVVLDGVSGVLRPGTLTLLLSPPGHGKSALLKALTQLLPSKELGGTVTYSGLTPAAARAAHVHLGSLCQYVSQLDEHLVQLTVRETLEFVQANATVDPGTVGFPALHAEHARGVTDIVELLHLEGCANTVIGNELLRGVSGGEKKRVTVGEGLMTNARFLALDEISTGLDSAVTFDICKRLRARASDQGLTVVTSLLQPTPETFNLFDEVILMREGATIYHGSRAALIPYLRRLGYEPPSEADAEHAVSSVDAHVHGSKESLSLDLADWLLQFLADPEKVFYATRLRSIGMPAALVSSRAIEVVAGHKAAAAVLAPGGSMPLTTAALAAAWRASPEYAAQMAAPPVAQPLALEGSFALAQYSKGYSHSPLQHTGLLLMRQLKLMSRNMLYVRSRISSAVIMAIILGGLYYQRSTFYGFIYFGLFLNCLMTMGFANLSEMAAAVENKYIAYRQVANGFYPSYTYVIASAITHVPVAVVECFIFTGIIYGMSGQGPSVASYFFLWLTVFLFDLVMRNLLVLFSLQGKTLAAAQAAPLPIIALMILFGGFLVTRNKMGWLAFMSYIDPIAYGLRSLAINEFMLPRYAVNLVYVPRAIAAAPPSSWTCLPSSQWGASANISCLTPPVPGVPTLGETWLTQYDIPTTLDWQWGGIGFLIGSLLLTLLCQFRVFATVRFDRNIGSSRKSGTGVAGGTAAAAAAALAAGSTSTPTKLTPAASLASLQGAAPGLSAAPSMTSLENAAGVATSPHDATVTLVSVPAAALPAPALLAAAASPAAASPAVVAPAAGVSHHLSLALEPMTVAWKDITYTVTLSKQAGGGFKTLLRGISGYAKPGRLLALMGASGAGKTTLLDVLGGRKNSGVMTGSITLNGFPKEARSFNRVTAYVEQMDVHAPFATVRESLEFSAALRLPSHVTNVQRASYVTEVLELLELEDVAERKVGIAGAPDAIAPHERKRLTIGVELVSNAPVLFLDEPTSGLDSRAAAVVMRVIRNVAQTGRTVICTIHQPSAELFFAFDDLLLLQRGGWQCYFGELGRKGRALVAYLSGLPGVPPCPKGTNPSTWMLDVLQGFGSSAPLDNVSLSAKLPAAGEPPAAAGGAAVESGSAPAGALIAGEGMQAAYFASPVGAAAAKELALVSAPAPGASKVAFPSFYAASAATQVYRVTKRAWIASNRNIGQNFGRLVAFCVLNLMFGTIWYKIAENASDVAGVQSLISCIFMGAAFGAMVCMNTAVPGLIQVRAVFYREQASAMYDPSVYSLALFLTELPWLGFVVLTGVSIGYFMFGLRPDAASFFFHFLVSYTLAVVYVSIGQTVAAVVPSFEVAQAILGLLGPLFFLFGGLWSPPSQMAPGAQWFCYIDPITYAFRALIPPQFYCAPPNIGPGLVLDAATGASFCPSIDASSRSFPPSPGAPLVPKYPPAKPPAPNPNVPSTFTYEYVSELYEINYDDRWVSLGFLVIFILAFQLMHFAITRRVRHIVR